MFSTAVLDNQLPACQRRERWREERGEKRRTRMQEEKKKNKNRKTKNRPYFEYFNTSHPVFLLLELPQCFIQQRCLVSIHFFCPLLLETHLSLLFASLTEPTGLIPIFRSEEKMAFQLPAFLTTSPLTKGWVWLVP